jgi:hypothetical protein
MICRLLLGLEDQSTYVLCATAEDSASNLQLKPLLATFTTPDGTPPAISFTATAPHDLQPSVSQPSSPPSARIVTCIAFVNVTLSEAATGTVVAVDAAFLGESEALAVRGSELLKSVAEWSGGLSTAALGSVAFSVQSVETATLQIVNLPCESRILLLVSARDSVGNVQEVVAVAEVRTPDVRAPAFGLGLPAVIAVGDESVWLEVGLDEEATVAAQVRTLYLVLLV